MSIRIDCLFDLNFDLEQKRNEIPSALKFQIGREQTGQRIHPCEFHPLFSLSRSISLFFPLGRWFSVAGAHEASRSLPFLGYRASEDDTLRLVKLGRSCVYFERNHRVFIFARIYTYRRRTTLFLFLLCLLLPETGFARINLTSRIKLSVFPSYFQQIRVNCNSTNIVSIFARTKIFRLVTIKIRVIFTSYYFFFLFFFSYSKEKFRYL